LSSSFRAIAAAALLASLSLSVEAAAPTEAPFLRNLGGPTAERGAADYLGARTLAPNLKRLPASVFDLNAAAEAALRQTPTVVPGRRGGADARHLATKLTVPPGLNRLSEGGVVTESIGTGGLNYTSSRVWPKALDTTYPVRTVGRLFYTINGEGYNCTASVIKPGLVLTSGHCVHSGNNAGSGWYSNFEFIPGYRKVGSEITKPYGSWTNWLNTYTTNKWYAGGGVFPNAGDWALVVFDVDSTGKHLGDYTGWLGYGTDLSIGRHLTVLGYPGNLDAGGQLHRVDAMGTDYGSLNNVSYGSDMQGGSSGGPLVMNWRVDYTDSSSAPSENSGNLITSTVSWGFNDLTRKVQGGTQFDSGFSSLLNEVCTAFPSAC
jgi:V8-like Glu-specific endopeptidase